MRAGTLTERVTIQETTQTQDGDGGIVDSWADVATVWAAVEPLTGREFFDAAKVNAEVSSRIRIRALSGIVPKMRAVHGSDIYDIHAVMDVDSRGREIHLMVSRED